MAQLSRLNTRDINLFVTIVRNIKTAIAGQLATTAEGRAILRKTVRGSQPQFVECREKGHTRNYCPKKKNPQGEEARRRDYVIKEANKDQGPNVVMGTFLLNNCYATVLFDSGSDKSFVNTSFSHLIDIDPAIFFKIDLMPIELGTFDVIIGMDWLVEQDAVIMCGKKVLHVPYKNKTLVVEGDRDPAKIASIKNWATPTTPTEKNKKFEWETEAEEAFQTLKQKLCCAPILALPEGSNDFVRRWIKLLSDYDCEIRYHPRKENVVADALSQKEREPIRVKALVMIVCPSLHDQIRNAQSKAMEKKNVKAKNLGRIIKPIFEIHHDGTRDKEKELWVELKWLFELDSEDQLWPYHQAFMHDPLDWKLYDTCGVHHVSTKKNQEIFMTPWPIKGVLRSEYWDQHCLGRKAQLLEDKQILSVENAPPTLKDQKFWTAEEKKTQKIDRLARSLLIQGLPNDIYSLIDSNETAKDLWNALERQMRGSEYDEQDRKDAILYKYETFKANEGEQLLDTYLRYLQVINVLKKCGYKKYNCELNYKFLSNLQPEWKQYESGADDFSELKKITALLEKAFNRRKFYSKPTNNNLRTSSTSQSANKKQEFFKSDDKKEDKKADEKKREISKVKCYNWKKEGHFSNDCKKAK
nr:hypothetical protein [Tanacetum cinerariifolium]